VCETVVNIDGVMKKKLPILENGLMMQQIYLIQQEQVRVVTKCRSVTDVRYASVVVSGTKRTCILVVGYCNLHGGQRP